MSSAFPMSMRMTAPLLSLTTALCLCASGAAQGTMPQQTNPATNSSTTGTPSPGLNGAPSQISDASAPAANGALMDKTFAKKALQGGMAEVELGKLAQQKSNSEDVKKFGQQMVDDHTKLNEQMKPIAASLGVEAPTEVSSKDKKLAAKLELLSGNEFDQAYIRAMLKDHRDDDRDFQLEAHSGQNQQEKDAAMQGDQIVQQHLQMVMDLAKAHGIPAGKGL